LKFGGNGNVIAHVLIHGYGWSRNYAKWQVGPYSTRFLEETEIDYELTRDASTQTWDHETPALLLIDVRTLSYESNARRLGVNIRLVNFAIWWDSPYWQETEITGLCLRHYSTSDTGRKVCQLLECYHNFFFFSFCKGKVV